MGQRIHIIINPAAGLDRPLLGVLNRAFQQADVDWEVSITKRRGDAERLARQAAARGVDAVAVYGGDGTVTEAASGLVGSDVPLAIFPGGTANVMSVELGIPGELEEACALVSSALGRVRAIDIGRVNGRYFLLRVGIGFEAKMVEGADRELKSRLGVLAYAVSAIQALRQPQIARYRPTLDAGPLLHWQAREITVEADPPQTVQADGELLGTTPVRVSVIPQAAKVIVPATVP